MSPKMHILGWESKGLRCPDHKIDCCGSLDRPSPVTLIQMPNGTGKTTTLKLLRAALSGSAQNNSWEPSEVREFQKRTSPAPAMGCFELKLLLGGKRATILMNFDFETGRISYKTTRLPNGQVERFDPPIEFRRFMEESFVRFYIFDGELADNILSKGHTDAKQAIESLFQIHLFDKMKDSISTYWDELTKGETALAEAGLTRRRNTLKKWSERLEELLKERKDCKNSIKNVRAELKKQRARHTKEINKSDAHGKKISTIKQRIESRRDQINGHSQKVLDSLRDPHAMSDVFSDMMVQLRDGLDRVKLPESAAREFFEELVDDGICVCGRPIDNDVGNLIKKRSARYLDSEDVALLNSMKTAIADVTAEAIDKRAKELSEDIKDLEDLVHKHEIEKTELDGLESEAGISNPGVIRAREEIKGLERAEKEFEIKLKSYDERDENIDFNKLDPVDLRYIKSVGSVKKGIKVLEEMVGKATNTLEQKKKREILKTIIEKAHQKAGENIKSEIMSETNKCINSLMPDNPIAVEKIDSCVVLKDQASGSAGENLSVGYAFLATLFGLPGGHRLPFIVDSPANPIDNEIRPKIGRLVPHLTHQFIAFVISSEREHFVPSIQEATKQKIKYITLFRENISRYKKKAERYSDALHVTSDGIQVEGKEFFEGFQLNSEEDE